MLILGSSRLADASSKDSYYRVLAECSQGWHEGHNEILSWWNYFLGAIRSAYRELETQIDLVAGRPAKGNLVRQTVLQQVGEFSLADLAVQLPTASTQLIKKVLGQLKGEGRVHLVGRGRSATWTLKD